MATKKKSVNADVILQQWGRQFKNLDPKDAATWPFLPKLLMFLLIAAVVVAIGWFAWLTQFDDELEGERVKEVALRQEYRTKLTKAVSLDELKKQREQIQQFVMQLEKQLPSKAEMAALLSDINQAGLGRSLQFELFRPGQVIVKQYYAELPIAVKVNGKYHDMGSFASDLAYLSRIVTLSNLAITPLKEGGLSMEVTARTFRYLDAEEREVQQKAKVPAK